MSTKGKILLFAAMAAVMSSGASTVYDDKPIHGGGGHGNKGRSRNVVGKQQKNRRKKEKNARKARRKQR